MVLHLLLLVGAVALGGVFLVLYIWAVKDGQFEDLEEAKYLMFREPDKQEPGIRSQESGAEDAGEGF